MAKTKKQITFELMSYWTALGTSWAINRPQPAEMLLLTADQIKDCAQVADPAKSDPVHILEIVSADCILKASSLEIADAASTVDDTFIEKMYGCGLKETFQILAGSFPKVRSVHDCRRACAQGVADAKIIMQPMGTNGHTFERYQKIRARYERSIYCFHPGPEEVGYAAGVDAAAEEEREEPE